MRSNLWQGAAAVASGAAFTNVYVGWGVKTERFLPLPPPPVAQEYDQVRWVKRKPNFTRLTIPLLDSFSQNTMFLPGLVGSVGPVCACSFLRFILCIIRPRF